MQKPEANIILLPSPRQLEEWFQSGIIPKKSYIKLALLLTYGSSLEELRKDNQLVINLEEVKDFCDRFSIEKEDNFKALKIIPTDCQAILLELIEGIGLYADAIAFINTNKVIQLNLLENDE